MGGGGSPGVKAGGGPLGRMGATFSGPQAPGPGRHLQTCKNGQWMSPYLLQDPAWLPCHMHHGVHGSLAALSLSSLQPLSKLSLCWAYLLFPIPTSQELLLHLKTAPNPLPHAFSTPISREPSQLLPGSLMWVSPPPDMATIEERSLPDLSTKS